MVVFKKLHNFILFLVLSKDEGIPGHVKEKNTLGFTMLNSKMFEEFIFSIHKGFDLRWARHANVLGLIETHLNGQWHLDFR